MPQWIWNKTIRMSSKTSWVVMLLLKRTKLLRRGQFRLKLSGSEFLEHGWGVLLSCIHITSQSSRNIGRLLWSCFMQFQISLVSLSGLTLMFGTVMRSGLSIWMTDLNLTFCFFPRCSSARLLYLAQNGLVHPSVLHHQNVWRFLVLIGTKGFVKTWTFAWTIVSMASVVNAGADTEQKTTWNAKLLSKLAQEK
jgi:hypothetical protein